jgi:anti-sigma B factor antagonist
VATVEEVGPAKASVEVSPNRNGTVTITLSGELDMSNVELVRDRLGIGAGQSLPAVIVDLAELSFMDSSGIALLVQLAGHTEQIALRNVSPLIERVLAATGVNEILTVAP